jgi:hypothetical protein
MSDRAHGSVEGGSSLEGVQLGDTIVVINELGNLRRAIVTAAGPVWVTALGTRFRRANGQAASGASRPCAMTVTEDDRREETRRVLSVFRAWGLTRGTTAVRELTLPQLAQVAALLDRFGRQQSLPDGLRDSAFGRTGCLRVDGESLLAARARGSAAECAEDAAELLRKGDVAEAQNLLDSAAHYISRQKGEVS